MVGCQQLINKVLQRHEASSRVHTPVSPKLPQRRTATRSNAAAHKWARPTANPPTRATRTPTTANWCPQHHHPQAGSADSRSGESALLLPPLCRCCGPMSASKRGISTRPCRAPSTTRPRYSLCEGKVRGGGARVSVCLGVWGWREAAKPHLLNKVLLQQAAAERGGACWPAPAAART